MTGPLSIAVLLYAAAICCWIAVDELRHKPETVARTAALWTLEAGLIAQAVADAFEQRGGRPHEFATHWAYLATSVLLLPILVGAVHRDVGFWKSLTEIFACAAVIIVTLRLHATWTGSRA